MNAVPPSCISEINPVSIVDQPRLFLKKLLRCFLLISLLTTAQADVIFLQNGDRISGKIFLIEENTVHVKTDYAGILQLNNRNIVQFSLSTPVSVKESRFTESIPATEVVYDVSRKGGENRLFIKSHGLPKSIPFNKELVVAKVNGATLKAQEWKHSGNVDLSANFDQDSSKTARYRFKGLYKLEHNLWRHGFTGNIYRKRDNDRTKSYYYNVGYSVDRFFTRSLFWQGSIDYQYDWIEDIRENFLVGAGPGWQVWDDARSSLSLATLLNYQELHFKEGDDSSNPLMTLKWDYQQYLLNQQFKFSSTGTVGRSFNQDVTLDLNLNATLAYKLTDSLSLNTGFQFERLKAKRGDSKNRSFSLGIGYQW